MNLLLIQGVDGILCLGFVKRFMLGHKGFVFFSQSVPDDIALEGGAVRFLDLVAAGLQFPTWDGYKLRELLTNQ